MTQNLEGRATEEQNLLLLLNKENMGKRIAYLFLTFLILDLKAIFSIEQANANIYSSIVDKMIIESQNDTLPYHRLSYMCDVFGPRLSGSENLEKTLIWMLDEMKKDGFANVRADSVKVPHWVRKYEKCELVYPRNADIPVFALGGTISTPKGGIEAEVITVKSFDELESRKGEVKGKIVVYNFPYEGYGKGVQYRFHGAHRAAKYGAVATLIRSISPNVSRNVHTGMMTYADSVIKIPHAAISPEDAMLLERLISYGITPKLRLNIDAETLPDATSFNLIGEITGEEYPDEIIAVGGHTDSWDAGTGAHDNAGGCIVTWEAVRLIKKIGLKPKRTIRIVQWTNEENGVRGGNTYRDMHKDENHVLMFEHDSGIFPPKSVRFTGPEKILEFIKTFDPLFKKFGNVDVTNGGGGVDIGPMMKLGIPGMNIGTDDAGKYFYYHHNHSDTVDKVKKEDLNSCIAIIAAAIYLYSELPSEMLSK